MGANLANYSFQTITAAQALAFDHTVDMVVTDNDHQLRTFSVSFNDAAQQVTIADPATGRTVVFGSGMYGGLVHGWGGDAISIGTPGADYKEGIGSAYFGAGADTIFGGSDVWGGPGADLFVSDYAYHATLIRDWEAGDRLYMSTVAPNASNYVELTVPARPGDLDFFNSQESVAKEQFAAGKVYVVIATGSKLEVYADTFGLGGSPMSETIILGKTLADISPSDFVSGKQPLSPGLPPPGPTYDGAQGSFIGNMDTFHLSRFLGATIEAATPTGLQLRSADSVLSVTGTGFTFDVNEQLTGGSVTHIGFSGPGYNINLSTPNLSAAKFGQWVATDANLEAFSTILAGNDSLGGGPTNDVLHGYSGNDLIYGAGASDTIYGGAGDDQIFALYPPALTGGGTLAPSYMRGDEGNDSISGGGAFDDINGNMGNDTAHGNDGGDWVVGGKDQDLLYGDGGDDIVYGNMGDDTCYGGTGADTIRGGQDNDTMSGAEGNDWLSGDRGADTISGGSGADTFYLFRGSATDRVIDFNRAEGDRVQLDPGQHYALRQDGADAVIDLGDGDQLILVGVQASTLTGAWLIGG